MSTIISNMSTIILYMSSPADANEERNQSTEYNVAVYREHAGKKNGL